MLLSLLLWRAPAVLHMENLGPSRVKEETFKQNIFSWEQTTAKCGCGCQHMLKAGFVNMVKVTAGRGFFWRKYQNL